MHSNSQGALPYAKSMCLVLFFQRSDNITLDGQGVDNGDFKAAAALGTENLCHLNVMMTESPLVRK